MNFTTNSMADAIAHARDVGATDPSNAVGLRLRGLRQRLASVAASVAGVTGGGGATSAPAAAVATATLNGREIVPERDGPPLTRKERHQAKVRRRSLDLAAEIDAIPDATMAWLLDGRDVPVSLAQLRTEFAEWATLHPEHRKWLSAWPLFLKATMPTLEPSPAPHPDPIPIPTCVAPVTPTESPMPPTPAARRLTLAELIRRRA